MSAVICQVTLQSIYKQKQKNERKTKDEDADKYMCVKWFTGFVELIFNPLLICNC